MMVSLYNSAGEAMARTQLEMLARPSVSVISEAGSGAVVPVRQNDGVLLVGFSVLNQRLIHALKGFPEETSWRIGNIVAIGQ